MQFIQAQSDTYAVVQDMVDQQREIRRVQMFACEQKNGTIITIPVCQRQDYNLQAEWYQQGVKVLKIGTLYECRQYWCERREEE